MGGASSYSTQFLSHTGPRGPPGMTPGGMLPSRHGHPPSTGGLYTSHHAQMQKMPQHGGYSGGQQGLKRPFHSEVSSLDLYDAFCLFLFLFGLTVFEATPNFIYKYCKHMHL